MREMERSSGQCCVHGSDRRQGFIVLDRFVAVFLVPCSTSCRSLCLLFARIQLAQVCGAAFATGSRQPSRPHMYLDVHAVLLVLLTAYTFVRKADLLQPHRRYAMRFSAHTAPTSIPSRASDDQTLKSAAGQLRVRRPCPPYRSSVVAPCIASEIAFGARTPGWLVTGKHRLRRKLAISSHAFTVLCGSPVTAGTL